MSCNCINWLLALHLRQILKSVSLVWLHNYFTHSLLIGISGIDDLSALDDTERLEAIGIATEATCIAIAKLANPRAANRERSAIDVLVRLVCGPVSVDLVIATSCCATVAGVHAVVVGVGSFRRGRTRYCVISQHGLKMSQDAIGHAPTLGSTPLFALSPAAAVTP